MDRFNKDVTIKGQHFLFHDSVKTNELEQFKDRIENKGINGLFNQVYGRLASKEEKSFRKILNAVIKAKNNAFNKNKAVIRVKMSDSEVHLKPLLFK